MPRFALASVVLIALAITRGDADAQTTTSPDEHDIKSHRGEHRLSSDIYGNTRTLRIVLPPSYHDPTHADRRYPVFYFTDGIAAMEAWGVAAEAEDLWRRREIQEVIFVCIDNGGSTSETTNPVLDRASEYIPYRDQTWTEPPIPEPRGHLFPAFLFDEVMPLIDNTYRTKTGAAHTGLAGDSFAGAAALHTGLKHPDRIGMLLLESPALHVGDEQLLRDAESTEAWPAAIYVGVGTAEGDTPQIQEQMVTLVRRLNDITKTRAPMARSKLVVVEGGVHWYSAWRERLPTALRFLIGTTPPEPNE